MGLSTAAMNTCAAIRQLHPRVYDLALAIQAHEGFYAERGPGRPASRAWRNNNPGNLRASPLATGNDGPDGKGGMAVFPDYYTGLAALLLDLVSKCLGKTNTNLTSDSTLAQLVRVWAPPNENDTDLYVSTVATRLHVSADVKLSALLWS
jgi:hypothetical protein